VKKAGWLLAIAWLLLLPLGCGDDGGKEVKNNTCGTFKDLVGTWRDAQICTLIFQANYQYAVFSNGELSSGAFAVDGCRFIFDESEDGGGCYGLTGIYEFDISADRDAMNVQLVSDDCEPRAGLLDGADFILDE